MMDNLADVTIQLRQSDGELTHRLDRNPVGAPMIPPATASARKLVERAELQVIHAVIADPRWREPGILQRLRPDDFLTSRAPANTWRAIQAVSARGEPIDPVTVAWEAELLATDLRHGVGAQDRVGLSATELSSMTVRPPRPHPGPGNR